MANILNGDIAVNKSRKKHSFLDEYFFKTEGISLIPQAMIRVCGEFLVWSLLDGYLTPKPSLKNNSDTNKSMTGE